MHEQEREAVRTLKMGDIGGLEALVMMHQLQALRVAYGIVGDRQTAEDIVADAFLTIYDRIDRYDESRPFAPWLYRIVVNTALQMLRNGRRILFDNIEERERLLGQPDVSAGPEAAAEQQELRGHVLAAIYGLPPEQRAAVILRYYLDLDEAAIALAVNCPLGTLKWRLHAAKQKLREALANMEEPMRGQEGK